MHLHLNQNTYVDVIPASVLVSVCKCPTNTTANASCQKTTAGQRWSHQTQRPIPPTRHGAATAAGLPRLVHFWQLHSAFQAHTEPAPCPLPQGLKYSCYSKTVDDTIISLENADLWVAGLWTIQLLCWRLWVEVSHSFSSKPKTAMWLGHAVAVVDSRQTQPATVQKNPKTHAHTQKARSDLWNARDV